MTTLESVEHQAKHCMSNWSIMAKLRVVLLLLMNIDSWYTHNRSVGVVSITGFQVSSHTIQYCRSDACASRTVQELYYRHHMTNRDYPIDVGKLNNKNASGEYTNQYSPLWRFKTSSCIPNKLRFTKWCVNCSYHFYIVKALIVYQSNYFLNFFSLIGTYCGIVKCWEMFSWSSEVIFFWKICFKWKWQLFVMRIWKIMF